MLGYRKVEGYYIEVEDGKLVMRKCVAVAWKKGFSNKDLVKLQRIAEAFADSKQFKLEIRGRGDKAEIAYFCYYPRDNRMSLSRDIGFVERALKWVSKDGLRNEQRS